MAIIMSPLWRVYLWMLTVSVVRAVPVITFPLNAQVPPIAYVAEPYSYTFPQSTFTSVGSIIYSLTQGPVWLKLDNGTRHLSGQPTALDVGKGTASSFSLEITASDDTGSVVMASDLIVSKRTAPIANIALDAQLPSLGLYAEPFSLLYHPGTPFSFAFDKNTFISTGADLTYYAMSADYTPLPAWIAFDSATLEFRGRTPDIVSIAQTPQIFAMQLIASDMEGFAGTSLVFQLEVRPHILAFEKLLVSMNASRGEAFASEPLRLVLDDQTVASADLVAITADTPLWLAFDKDQLQLRGTPPASSGSINVTVKATDIYQNSAISTVQILLASPSTQLFGKAIKMERIAPGSNFSLDLGTYLQNRTDTRLVVVVDPQDQWLHFDGNTFLLWGQAPNDTSPREVNIIVNATSISSGIFQTAQVDLNLEGGSTTSTIASSSSTSTPTMAVPRAMSSDNARSTKAGSPHTVGKDAIIAMTVALAVLAIVTFLCLLCVFRRRRAKQRRQRDPISKHHISAPVAGSFRTDAHLQNSRPYGEGVILDMGQFDSHEPTNSYTGAWNEAHASPHGLRKSCTEAALDTEAQELRRTRDMSRSYSDNALSGTDQTIDSFRSTIDSSLLDASHDRTSPGRRTSRLLDLSRLDQPIAPPSAVRGSWNYSIYGNPNIEQVTSTRHSTAFISANEEVTVQPQATSEKILQSFEYGGPNEKPPINKKSSKRKRAAALKRLSGSSMRGGVSFRDSSRLTMMTEHGSIFTEEEQHDPCVQVPDHIAHQGGRASHGQSSSDSPESRLHYPFRRAAKQRQESVVSRGTSVSGSTSRPVSRRIGSSPFFGGSMQASQKRRLRRTLQDSLDDSDVNTSTSSEIPHETSQRNSRASAKQERRPTLVYSSPHEGTRKLRSFIDSQNLAPERSNTLRSARSMSSHDSKPRCVSMSDYSNVSLAHDPLTRDDTMPPVGNLLEDDGDPAWEDEIPRDEDSRQSLQRALDEFSGMQVARARSSYPGAEPWLRAAAHDDVPPSLSAGMPMGMGVRMVPGRGQRPNSVSGPLNQQSSWRGRIQDHDDYQVYI